MLTVPWALAVLPHNRLENRGALISIDYLALVRRSLIKTNLAVPLGDFVNQVFSGGTALNVILFLATVWFLVGGLGGRVVGLWKVLRSAIGGVRYVWTILAWVVIIGIAIPFFVSIAPFPNSIQTYMMAMFALSLFAAWAVWPAGARETVWRYLASAVVLGVCVPATVHYVTVAHAATAEKAILEAGDGDLRVIRYLRTTDPKTTMVLHSDPLNPSVYAVEAERRVVLAWSSYVSGDENPVVDALSARIAAFFGSPKETGKDDVAFLQEQGVTHVIERTAVDQLHPNVRAQLRAVAGTPSVVLYEVPAATGRGQ